MPRLLILFLIVSLPALQGARAADPAKPSAARPSVPAKTATAQTSKTPGAPKPAEPARKKKPRPKGPGVTGRAVNPNAPALKPKGNHTPETGFLLSRIADKPGMLSLAFRSRNPNLALNTKSGLVAQIYSDEEIEVEPSILTAENWPKNSDKLLLKYSVKDAKKGEEYEVQGQIAYTVCHTKTNVCESRKSIVYLVIVP